MLPALNLPGPPVKRPRQKPPPCREELAYVDGEVLNVASDRRVQGSSSRFFPHAFGSLLDEPFPSTWAHLNAIISDLNTPPSWSVVLHELYAGRAPRFAPPAPVAGRAFVKANNNDSKAQYYLTTTTKEEEVVHIQTEGLLWHDEDACATEGDLAYTNGFLWTNASPNWTWKSTTEEGRLSRCRITLPAQTQVVIDRSPVFGGSPCQFDDSRTSVFPDVLLPPGADCSLEPGNSGQALA